MARDNDDDVKRIRNSIRVEERIAWSMMLMLLAWTAIAVGIFKFHLSLENGGITAFIVLLAWITFVFRSQRASPLASAGDDEGLLRQTIDDQHRRWRWQFVLLFIFIGGAAVALSFVLLLPDASAARRTNLSLFAIWIPYLVIPAVVAALQVCFGPRFSTRAYRDALNDELTRALQGRAATFGYLLSVIAMCIAVALGAIRPQWGVAALPGAIAAAVILPGFYFLILQWHAGRDG